MGEARNDCGRDMLRGVAANDNGGAQARVEAAVLIVARLLGSRIAREECDRLEAANDNTPAKRAGERQES